MKLVPQNINEAIKHLKARPDEEVEIAREELIQDILKKDPSEMIHSIYDEMFAEDTEPNSFVDVASLILSNIDSKQIEEAVRLIMYERVFNAAKFKKDNEGVAWRG